MMENSETIPVEQNQPIKVFWGKITLNSNISIKNFVGCLVHYFMLSFIFVTIDSLQPQLLQKKFNIDKKDQIQNFKNLIVISFDIVVKVCTAPFFGYFADTRGRKLVNIYGLFFIGVSMIIMPYTEQFYQYILLRCIYAQGAIAISVMPFLADYVSPKSRGTCAAILVFMSSLGAISSAELNFTILSRIDDTEKLFFQYGIAACLVFIVGFIYSVVCLKGGNTYYLNSQNTKKSFHEMVKVGINSFKRPQIVTGYLSAFLARSDSILLSLYLVLWVYSFKAFQTWDEASSRASALSGITYTIIMFSCIVYGILYNKRKIVRQRTLLIVMLTLAFIGSVLINFSHSVTDFMTYVALAVLGSGMSGLLTASLYLVNQYSTKQHRGYITGIQTIFGILGITFQTLFGALLYEFVNRNGPFNYFCFVCLVGIILTIIVYRKFKSQAQEEKSLLTERDSGNEVIE